VVASLTEDEVFQNLMEKNVRVSVDGERETLEDLLNRALTSFTEERITWTRLIGFFSKRGRMEGYFELSISPRKRGQAYEAVDE